MTRAECSLAGRDGARGQRQRRLEGRRQQHERQARRHLVGRHDAVEAGKRGEHHGRDLEPADGESGEQTRGHVSSLP